MAFVYSGAGSLDYSPCRYGMSKLIFRGPKQALDRPYTVVLGGTETYGKFVAQPYPSVLAQKTDRLVVNLGYVNAGPDAYLNDPGTLAIAAASEVAIVQLIGAANVSNRFYTVHPRRNDRFVMATPWLRSLFPEVDFTEFHFTGHLVQTLHHVSPKRFALVAAELRAVWLDRMRQLLGRLSGKVVLLWMADQPPPPAAPEPEPSARPLLVDAKMIAELRSAADAYVEYVISLAAATEPVTRKVFDPLEEPAALDTPGPLAHVEAAAALEAALKLLMPAK
ncbi:MAG: DUF6473 family protein [Pseudorhodobacter sp.]|nr:DUF6473 family protein [Pseudorhodobacter sp.]